MITHIMYQFVQSVMISKVKVVVVSSISKGTDKRS